MTPAFESLTHAKQFACSPPLKKITTKVVVFSTSGGREIRTLGPVSQTLVFKTSAIDHSAIPPYINFLLFDTIRKAMKIQTWYAIPMKLMGIDYGTKRVGIALTDDKGMMAFPRVVLPNDASLIKSIERMVAEEKVGVIVVGHSLGRDGAPNKVHAQVEEFIQDLTLHIGLPVELEPEQYTTQEAIRVQGRNEMTDASAASVILNSYLLKIENRK